MESLDALYGAAEVVLERVSDPQRSLGETSRQCVEQEVARFETAFPQAFVAVRVASLGSASALRQFGFWLLNRAALTDGEITRPNENGVLILIDPPARLASITIGYQLEWWLPESALAHVLDCARHDFQNGGLAAGAVRLVRDLGETLRRSLRAPAVASGEFVAPAPLEGLPRLPVRPEGEPAHRTPSQP